jgi:hypothetical protein
MSKHYYGDDLGDDLGAFGTLGMDGTGRAHFVGPLIGGGAAQIGTIGAKLLFKGKPAAKWGAAIGLGLGGLASGALMFSPKYRATGLAGLITVGLVTLPRLIEDLLTDGAGLKGDDLGDLGVITPERELAASDIDMMDAMGQVQLLDSGSGGGTGMGLGVITPEREMAGMGQVEMMGGDDMGDGFGSNFLSPA